MDELLENLSKDIFPRSVQEEFVDWCIWSQAQPALVLILQKTGLDDDARVVSQASDNVALAAASKAAGQHANDARKITGPLGLSSAEASAFLLQKMASFALEDVIDAEAIAFYSAQICGWRGFAESGFTTISAKQEKEEEARSEQSEQLKQLWDVFQHRTGDD